MRYEVRACSSAAELRDAVRPIWHYFGRSGPADDQFERLARVLPVERMIAAWQDGRAPGQNSQSGPPGAGINTQAQPVAPART